MVIYNKYNYTNKICSINKHFDKMVSIVIPVFNDEQYLRKSINSIYKQDFDYEKLEVVVVDNGSTDNTLNLAKSFDNIKLICEHDNLGSPYSARNRGIESSSGDIIILLDANCYPSKDWLINGLKSLEKLKADIIAGNVKFDFEGSKTLGKMYDAITNVNMKDSVEKNNSAPTANLFIRRETFNRVGMFPERIRSGGDIIWTKKCVQNGLILKYSEEAYVYKRARSFFELLKKKWRVGKGKAFIWFSEDNGIKLRRYIKSLRLLLPPSRKSIIKAIKRRGTEDMNKHIGKLIIVGYIIHLTTYIAIVAGLINFKFKITRGLAKNE